MLVSRANTGRTNLIVGPAAEELMILTVGSVRLSYQRAAPEGARVPGGEEWSYSMTVQRVMSVAGFLSQSLNLFLEL